MSKKSQRRIEKCERMRRKYAEFVGEVGKRGEYQHYETALNCGVSERKYRDAALARWDRDGTLPDRESRAY